MSDLRTLAAPPRSAPLAALWWVAHGDWDKAHEAAQADKGQDAAWVHAHLHRIEGDLPNAAYWYHRARKPVATDPLDDEWAMIAAALEAAHP